MTPRSLRQRRALLVTVSLLAAPAFSIAGAQRPLAATDSVALLPARRVPVMNSGTSVAVIDSAMIAASGARTLSELLLARVPGLSVRHQGGTEAEGFEISSRGMGPIGAGPAGVVAPMLVIDGIIADAHQALRVPGTSVTLSRFDDLMPAEVQRIEVLRGPAASALYGGGAAAGVIVVTTRRGSAGPLRLDVNAGAGLTQMAATFPANYELTSGAPQQFCNPRVDASRTAATCAPMTLYSWNPLERASPFHLGHSITGGAELSGTTHDVRLFGGLTAERVTGVTSDDRQSRLGVHGSVERSLPGHLTVSAQGSYLQRDATVPSRGSFLTNNNVITRGMLGSAYDDSLRGYRAVGASSSVTEQQAPSLSRTVGALRLGWNPVAWLNVDAMAGRDQARESAISFTKETGPLGTNDSYAFVGDRWTSGTMHVGAMTRYAAPASIALSTYLAYDDVRTSDRTTDSSGFGAWSSSFTWSQRRMHSQEATVRQHASWGDRLDVNGGVRLSVGRGLVAPLGPEAARSVDASLRLPSPRPDVQLRLRGAAGLVPLVAPRTVYLTGSGFGSYVTVPLRSRQGEREGGIDATFGTRARAELTWYKSHSRDVVVGDVMPSPVGFPMGGPLLADLSNSGFEAVVSAQILQRARFGWRSTVTVATLHDKVTHTSLPPLMSSNSTLAAGYPLQGYWTRSYGWSDANGDGLIATNEVTPGESSFTGPSRPTLELGMQNTVTFPRGVSLAALLDYRHGQYRDNAAELTRCHFGFLVCRGIEDPALSLADQARWSAMARGLTRDIVPASYLRLREVVLEWAPGIETRGMRRLAVRVVGQDLLTWTRYDGLDPEVAPTSFDPLTAPAEQFQSPLPRRVRVEVRMGVI